MAYISEHCKDVKHYLGVEDDFVIVHEFLDQYASVFPVAFFNDYHRTFLHNTYGLRICEARWGEVGRLSAIIHLMRDYCGFHIQHWSLEKILKEFPRYLMWFDLLRTEYKPDSRVMKGWGKEAGLFLKAPNTNTIPGNLLWAKCKAHKTSDIVMRSMQSYWSQRLNHTNRYIWDKAIAFYARYPEVTSSTIHDTMDFIYNIMCLDKNFSLAGRTLNSVIELTNEWHHQLQQKRDVGPSTWCGLLITPWKWEVDEQGDVWYITQILDSNKLLHEGKVMKHCVGSYTSLCKSGNIGIFTVEHEYYGSKSKCLTVEVNSRFRIEQIRGKCNRMPDKAEYKVIKKWASEKQLALPWGY